MRKKITEISDRIASGVLSSVQDEATTITALVLPFISALGYNISDPEEYRPEYPCDFRKDRGMCADGAILKDGHPVFLIECKKHTLPLSALHAGQLRSYFSVHSTAKLGILTNGVEYWFFTDSEHPNIMDDIPFLVFDLSKPEKIPYAAIALFTKSHYTDKVFMRMGVINRIKREIRQELQLPYGELARIAFAEIDFSEPKEPDRPLPAAALAMIRPMISDLVAPEHVVIHSETTNWCSIAATGCRNIAEVQFNPKGKKYLLMSVLKFKQPIENLEDILQFRDLFREATKKVLLSRKN